MIVIPAIDILGGQCVRLVRGDYGSAHRVAEDAFETARGFEADGAEYIHIVDLDGAKRGERVNAELICRLAGSVGVPVEVGGGIRDFEAIGYYLTHGISRCILGSSAYRDAELVRRAVGTYGDRIAVGIDATDGFVSLSGWTEVSRTHYLDFARLIYGCGVKNIIFTDIARDGTLTGANTEALAMLADAVDADITASGGVRDLSDIKSLAKLGLYGAIAGKSLYSGTLSLKEAIAAAKAYPEGRNGGKS